MESTLLTSNPPAGKNVNRELGTRIRSGLLWLAGADLELLKACKSTESHEVNRLASLGGLVLVPAALGAAGMGYLGSTIAPNPILDGVIGLAGGGIVLSIDRFVLTTLHKSQRGAKAMLRQNDRAANEDVGKPLSRRTPLFPIISRVLMTLIIGVVISHPIVMLLNARSITAQLNSDLSSGELALQKAAVVQKAALPEPVGLQAARTSLQTEQARSQCLGTLLSNEQSGVKVVLPCGSSSGLPYDGPIYRVDLARKSRLDTQVIPQLEHDVNKLNSVWSQELASIGKRYSRLENQYRSSFSYDYAAKLQALWQLAHQNIMILIEAIVFFLFFLTIDLTVLALKLSTPAGPYEVALDAATERDVISLLAENAIHRKATTDPAVIEARTKYQKTIQELNYLLRSVEAVAQAHLDVEHTTTSRGQETDDDDVKLKLEELSTLAAESIQDAATLLFRTRSDP